MNKVLWSNEMSLCVGLCTELDTAEFIQEAAETHKELTGDALPISDCFISKEINGLLWRLEIN